MSTPSIVAALATLSDLARLRILRLLDRQELSVGELGRALQLPQSTVSRHLKMLHDGGWLSRRVEGTASFYRLVRQDLPRGFEELWTMALRQLGSSPTTDEDDRRLAEVLTERMTDSRSYFGRVGGEWDHVRRELFGTEFTAEAMLSLLFGDWVIADLGCGTGNASELLAPLVKRVIAVDREPAMLEAARQRLAGLSSIEFRLGDLLQLPIDDGEVDVTAVVLVLHHLEAPLAAVQEMARVLCPGGTALIVDMTSHDRESYRYTMGHRHLGFSKEQVQAWAVSTGLTMGRYRLLRPDTTAKGPGLFAATLRKR